MLSAAISWSGLSGARTRPGLSPFYFGAAVDMILGVDFLAFGDALAQVLLPGREAILGAPAAGLLRALGLLLVAFGAATALFACAPRLRGLLAGVVAANWAWVALSCALIFAQPPLSGVGAAAMAPAGVLTAALALAQSRALAAALGRA